MDDEVTTQVVHEKKIWSFYSYKFETTVLKLWGKESANDQIIKKLKTDYKVVSICWERLVPNLNEKILKTKIPVVTIREMVKKGLIFQMLSKCLTTALKKLVNICLLTEKKLGDSIEIYLGNVTMLDRANYQMTF